MDQPDVQFTKTCDGVTGAVVYQASRIADIGDPGEVVVADAVRQLALGKGFAFEPAGETTLRGFDEPVRLWKASAGGDS